MDRRVLINNNQANSNIINQPQMQGANSNQLQSNAFSRQRTTAANASQVDESGRQVTKAAEIAQGLAR
jgi:hypothetical protein